MKNLMEQGTRCLLIQPKFSKFSSLNYVDVCKIVGAKYPIPPLGLMTVAALLPQNWIFKLIDINVEPLRDEYFEWADIVCTGGMLSQQPGIISIIDKAHRYGKKVVVGGPEPTSQPQLYQMADYLVLGEGENTIPAFLSDLEAGCNSGEYKSGELADMTEAVVPRFDLIRYADYLMMGMQFSRGCPYNCEFCNVIELFGRKSRTKTVKQVMSELQYLYDLNYRGHVFFVDDNFLGNRKCVEELLLSIGEWSKEHQYPFYFAAEATINLADDDCLLQMMKDVDFRFISIGIETPEAAILKMAQKKQNINKPITEIIKKIYSYGIVVDACFILGFDNETEQTASNMINCIQDAGICMAMVGTLFALPNTQLSRRLKKEGRLFEEGTTVRDIENEIDQMSSGLNFITTRARLDILRDYIKILETIYDPLNYYKRLSYMGLNLKRDNKHKPEFAKILTMVTAFLKICSKVGFSKSTGSLYWKMLFTILLKNPKAFESAISLAAMYIHFAKHSQFIIKLINEKIKYIEHYGEENYNRFMLCKTSLPS
ncbi:MAG: B12-binding domain-containing radical SAM protein, partial [Candidatus Atribacteria bacterium]|nr:B12-binding domain-containing radical SAM protein [Candidatus Atribacteria bacterium]